MEEADRTLVEGNDHCQEDGPRSCYEVFAKVESSYAPWKEDGSLQKRPKEAENVDKKARSKYKDKKSERNLKVTLKSYQ